LRISDYPWYVGGDKQGTVVRVLYDDESIYLRFRCEDRHIYAETTELNGRVYEDSCVEFFATIDPEAGPDYFNLEINCCGQILMGFGPDCYQRTPITPQLASRIRIETSLAGPTKVESPGDNGWWVAVAVTFEMLSEFASQPVSPAPGTIWRANFYRCGGRTDPQYACWNHVDAPEPDFHRPEFFGELIFSNQGR